MRRTWVIYSIFLHMLLSLHAREGERRERKVEREREREGWREKER